MAKLDYLSLFIQTIFHAILSPLSATNVLRSMNGQLPYGATKNSGCSVREMMSRPGRREVNL